MNVEEYINNLSSPPLHWRRVMTQKPKYQHVADLFEFSEGQWQADPDSQVDEEYINDFVACCDDLDAAGVTP